MRKMVSKRILLVTVCVAVLIAVVGVYAYSVMNNTNTKTFYFESKWSSDGKTYHMKMTFAIKGENLSITAEIDDKVYCVTAFLGLVFDMDHSGAIEAGEPAYMLYAHNVSRDPVRYKTAYKSSETPYLTFEYVEPMEPSPFHTCVFSESDHTYKVQIPLEELKLVNDLVYMCCVSGSCSFYEDFNFGLEV